jgi:hypothetical protein
MGPSERLTCLLSVLWRLAALSKWPPIDRKFCMGTIGDLIFRIPLERSQFSTLFFNVT